MPTPLRALRGVGPTYERALQQNGIHSAEELVAGGAERLPPDLKRFWQVAQDHLATITASAPPIQLTGGVSAPGPKEVAAALPGPAAPAGPTESKTTEKAAEEYWVASHAWAEAEVVLPRRRRKPGEGSGPIYTHYQLHAARVHELVVDPHQRISFVVSWIKERDGQEQPSTRQFSPMLIAHYNAHLPVLVVSLPPEQIEGWEHAHAVEDVLWETNVMLQTSTSTEDLDALQLLERQ